MKKAIAIIILISVIFNIEATTDQEEAPSVKVKQGIITGLKDISENGKIFHSYYGIPYAEPPVNNLRFKEPIPKSSWEGGYDGTKIPLSCPMLVPSIHLQSNNEVPGTLPKEDSQQSSNKDFQIFGTEDCLTLNVFTSQTNSSNGKVAVLVYIHGGGFHSGGSAKFKPYFLMDEEIVLVVIQYRLGILGFLSTEDEILPGNMGLKDQQLALKWVKENIECFGGDPNLVTIFGQSAGGSSVHYHMLSPLSKGLFQRAIMQSGTAISPFAYPTIALKSAKAAADHFNCSLKRGTQKYLECMQDLDFRDLISFASSELTTWLYPLKFTPRVDGNILPDRPDVLLKNGNYTKVDTMSGTTRDEGAYIVIYMIAKPTILKKLNENFREYGPKSLVLEDEKNPEGLALQIFKHYMSKTGNFTEEDYDNFEKLFTDQRIKLGSYITGRFLAKNSDVNLYLYEMDHFGSLSSTANIPSLNRKNWVSHGDDNKYLFGSKCSITKESDKNLRKFFITAWTNFAKYGNPSATSLPSNCSWEKATKSDFQYLSINEFPEMKEYKFLEVKNFWSRLKTIQNEIFSGI